MPVFRVEKNSNYTTMCNYHLRDQGLSLKGKGLLSMLLSLPDTWNYSVRGLSSITPDGVDGVLTALKELERLGYAVIDERYKSGLPVIITTNLKIAEIRNPQDVAYARIYSRILEMCTPVRISGEDRRKSIGKEKQQVVKEVFDL